MLKLGWERRFGGWCFRNFRNLCYRLCKGCFGCCFGDRFLWGSNRCCVRRRFLGSRRCFSCGLGSCFFYRCHLGNRFGFRRRRLFIHLSNDYWSSDHGNQNLDLFHCPLNRLHRFVIGGRFNACANLRV